jgi:hypothetical protein
MAAAMGAKRQLVALEVKSHWTLLVKPVFAKHKVKVFKRNSVQVMAARVSAHAKGATRIKSMRGNTGAIGQANVIRRSLCRRWIVKLGN